MQLVCVKTRQKGLRSSLDSSSDLLSKQISSELRGSSSSCWRDEPAQTWWHRFGRRPRSWTSSTADIFTSTLDRHATGVPPCAHVQLVPDIQHLERTNWEVEMEKFKADSILLSILYYLFITFNKSHERTESALVSPLNPLVPIEDINTENVSQIYNLEKAQ